MYKLKFWYIILLVSFIFTTVIYFRDSSTSNNNNQEPHNEEFTYLQDSTDKITGLIQKRWENYNQYEKLKKAQKGGEQELKKLRDTNNYSNSDSNSDSSNSDIDGDDSYHQQSSTTKTTKTTTTTTTKSSTTTTTGSTTLPENTTAPTPFPTYDPFDDEYFQEYFSYDSRSLTCFSTLFNYRNNQRMLSSLSTYVSADCKSEDGCNNGDTWPGSSSSSYSSPSSSSSSSPSSSLYSGGFPDPTGNPFPGPPEPPMPSTTWTVPPEPRECNISGCKPSVFPIPTTPTTPINQQGFQRLNFQIDTSYLNPNNDIGRSCRFIGEALVFGKESRGNCNKDRFIDCTYYCTEYDIVTPELYNYITSVLLPTTTEILSSMILIPNNNNGNNLKLNQDFWRSSNGKCDNISIPYRFTTSGLNSGKNLLLYVTSRPVAKLDSIAYTLHCNYNFKVLSGGGFQFGRPLAGIINFSPKYFQLKKYRFERENTLNFQRAVQATLHEFIHLLGFDPFFYNSYLDKNGKPHLNPMTTSTVTKYNPSGVPFTKTINYFNTPSIKWTLKNHFNCSQSSIGLQLEDIGDNDIVPSHFSSHMFFGELMTTSMNPTMTLSIFTVALLQDMGWYLVDTSFSQEYLYGKNEGCGFLLGSCENWSKSRGYFCEKETFGCSPDRRSFSFCGVREYPQDLENRFQHFLNPKLGGPRTHDFCPVFGYNSITKGVFCSQLPKIITRPTSLRDAINNTYHLLKSNSNIYSNIEYDAENENLRCFNIKSPNDDLATCFNQECDLEKRILRISIKDKWFDCPPQGGYVNDNRTSDTQDLHIECPSFDNACTSLTLPLLVPIGENLDIDDKPSEKFWYKSKRFWIPMAGAVGLTLFLLAGSIFVYRRYFKNRISNIKTLSAKTSELSTIVNDSATSSTRSDYSESNQDII